MPRLRFSDSIENVPLENATIDVLDQKIIRCAQLSPRVPFALVADVLDVSEQTIARRWRRLERDGIVRATALLRPSAVGQANWMVRVQVRPSGAEALARALAQREDVSWVTLAAGGAEVVCVLRARTSESRDELLMQKLPRTTPVLGMSVAMVIHRFVGSGSSSRSDWTGLDAVLTDEQREAIFATALTPPDTDSPFDLLPEDRLLIAALGGDGRASFTKLARAAHMSESRAARRVATLVEGGALYFDLDLAVSALGLHSSASLWLTVTPSELDRAGRALGAQREVGFAGAVTGPTNIVASIVCRDTEHLYRFATETVGAIPGVQAMEISPVLRHVKQAGSFTDGDRLAVT